jgi:hypothetical protein
LSERRSLNPTRSVATPADQERAATLAQRVLINGRTVTQAQPRHHQAEANQLTITSRKDNHDPISENRNSDRRSVSHHRL